MVLASALILSGMLSVVFAFVYSFGTRDLRRIQTQVATVNARLNVAQALLNETLEYSKTNPAVDPILQSLKLKPSDPAAPAAPPSSP